jgi:hypothetical protein
VEVEDLRSGLVDLEERLSELLADSKVLHHSLRVESARRLLRRGVARWPDLDVPARLRRTTKPQLAVSDSLA